MMMLNLLFAAGLLVGLSEHASLPHATYLEECYARAFEAAGHQAVIIPNTVNTNALREIVRRLDLVVLTGGADVDPARYGEDPSPRLGAVNRVRDAYEFALCTVCVEQHKPILGICRGIQMMNVFFGGSLYQHLPQDYQPPAGVARCRHGGFPYLGGATNSPLHSIVIEPDSRLARVLGTSPMKVNSHHHQGVKRLAPGFKVSARATDGFVEAIEHQSYPAAGFQFHPENTVSFRPQTGFDLERHVKIFRNILEIVDPNGSLSGGGAPRPVCGRGENESADVGQKLAAECGADYIVYVPKQPANPALADPTQPGDAYCDHTQVIWDDVRKLYYAFWTQASREGTTDMHVVFSRSADRGRTWTPPRVLAGSVRRSEPKPRAVWQQPMLAKTGRLYCLWNQQANDEALHHGLVFGSYSDDGGETWSAPEENRSVPRQFRDAPESSGSLPCWCNWQRPIRLGKDGRFFVGCTRHVKLPDLKRAPGRTVGSWVEFWQYENIDENPSVADIRITVLSGGEKALAIPIPGTDRFCCEEAAPVKLPDGRLFTILRSRARHPFWSQSRDGGATWTPPKPLCDRAGRAFLHPCSPAPMFDSAGCAAASGSYFALIHNAYDDSIPPLGAQNRGAYYLIRGTFDPIGEQPVAFDEPEMFLPLAKGNSCYASYTVDDRGEGILWFGHRKRYVVGRRMTREAVRR